MCRRRVSSHLALDAGFRAEPSAWLAALACLHQLLSPSLLSLLTRLIAGASLPGQLLQPCLLHFVPQPRTIRFRDYRPFLAPAFLSLVLLAVS